MAHLSNSWDVIIIGAGAAGLMAAAAAAARGLQVLVLEKNAKIGVKILMSGGTRCNITHHCDIRAIVDAFGKQGRFLHSALAALSPEDVIEKIESMGVATKVESTGKIFPVSDRAIDVRDALVKLATKSGANIQTEQTVVSIDRTAEPPTSDAAAAEVSPTFTVRTTDDAFFCRSVLITSGGRSFPGCGTTGDGYDWARHFGHSIVNTVPALTPVVCHVDWLHALKGITIEDVALEIHVDSAKTTKKKKTLNTGRGPLLFTHFGLSGPTAMNLSRTISLFETNDRNDGSRLKIVCDFLPEYSADSLESEFRARKKSAGKQPVFRELSTLIPRRLAETLMQHSDIAVNHPMAELSNAQLARLTAALKRTEIPVHGTMGFRKAEVTAGGVNLKEVDSRDMQSKLCPGLFFAGEILDLDGPIGGFNFQAAFSTGWLAGNHV